AVGAVHVAGTQGAAFEITELVEHEQRMIAGAGVMPVPDAHLLLAMGWAHARIHVEHNAPWRAAAVHKVDPLGRQASKSREVRTAPAQSRQVAGWKGCRRAGAMLTREDYRQLAERCALLAGECGAPGVAEALRALALDYLMRAVSQKQQQTQRLSR